MTEHKEIPQEWKATADGINKMRELFALALKRGLFASIEENAMYLNAYGSLEYEIKMKIQEAMAPKEEEAPSE
jgi:hypothetical protein